METTTALSPQQLGRLIRVSRGLEPADLVLANGRVVNVCTGGIDEAEVAVAEGVIAGVGPGYQGRERYDCAGRYLCPGFIDGHLHLESSLLSPLELARAVLPRGTTTVVGDPHEIANVLGLAGIHWLLAASADLPLSVFFTAPSCVPATPLETAGAAISAADLAPLLDHPRILGLAEVMNFPGLLAGDPEVLAKVLAARRRRLPVDGHCPGLSGRDLAAYVAAGIDSDHEATTAAEAREKLAAGMWLAIREGSSARNLADLLPGVPPAACGRAFFVSDDRHPVDLARQGHLDHILRLAVAQGLAPVTAVAMASRSPAERFGLRDRGMIAPGRRADLVLVEDLAGFRVQAVFAAGRLVARDGAALGLPPPAAGAAAGRVHIDWSRVDLAVAAAGDRLRVIGLLPGQLLTQARFLPVRREGGLAVADPGRDLLKLAVIERHQASGRVGLGFVQGFGLTGGALAGTVAHDSHNLIVVGTNDADMLLAARSVAELGGGLAVASQGRVLATLALPIAGLMTGAPLHAVVEDLTGLHRAAASLGCLLPDPFMALSFLALPVIPQLKLTDHGLVDVERFAIVPLFA
ncbi:MAG: adenine deaminase [Thermodesulfobacteriota bacterium]